MTDVFDIFLVLFVTVWIIAASITVPVQSERYTDLQVPHLANTLQLMFAASHDNAAVNVS